MCNNYICMCEKEMSTQPLKQCCQSKCKNSFSLEGNSGELYINEGVYKEITLIEPSNTTDDSYVGLSLHSIDRTEKHDLLNKFLNKNVKISISILDDKKNE